MANAVADTGTLVDNLTYNYGSNNRLSSVNDAAGQIHNWDAFSSSFDYDANGNMISQSGKFTNIAYDHRNLPVHFYLEGDDELIANYNAEGQRILKESSDGGWSFYITDGMQTLAVIEDDTLRYMNLVGNDTFGRLLTDKGTVSLSEPRRYYLKDHLGSTRAVVNNNGGLVETHDYYPFGLLMPRRSGGANTTREKFTGHELDDETDHYHMIARRYDPALGRFLSVDPLVDDYPEWSPYTYVLNNPLIFIDPTGMCPENNESEECVRSERTIFTGESAQALFRILVQSFEKGQELTQGAKDMAIDGVRFVAAEGPEFLDTVGDAAAQTTLIAGSATAASLKTPTLVDTKASASATVLFGGITLGTDLLATGLSGIDAVFFDGDRDEFRARLLVSTFGVGVTAGSGLLYKRELRRSILDRSTRRALNTTATTSTSKTATDPLKNR